MSGLLVLSVCSCLSLFFLPGLATPLSVTGSCTAPHAFCDPNNSGNCKKYESPGPHNLSSIARTKILYMTVNAAMNQALDALNHIKLYESKSQNERERAALSDCWKFYEFTIRQLNQTLDPTLRSTSFDTQMWLSAAITNLENCKTSIIELNVKESVFLPDNASELVSKSLAINADLMEENTHQKGFHSWLSDGDLRFLQLSENTTNLVVAQDGSGDFSTIKEALDASFNRKISGTRIVIHIKQGTYHEYLEISPQMKNIMLVGDGMRKTIITGNRSFAAGYTTFQSATVKVMGDGFVARDITFRNTAGAESSQAVALYSSSDQSAFYRCAFKGYQDTLCANSHRQFYQECHIYGTVDFIFGNAAVVFQNSFIYARKPKHGQSIVITAQGRTNPNQTTGISIINCKVQAEPNLKPVLSQYKAYLGRPWTKYARTIYLKNFLDSLINPLGWMEWGDHSRSRSVDKYKIYLEVFELN